MAKIKKMADNDSSGFEEEASSPFVVEPPAQKWRLKVGADGRVVIPAAARSLMELGEDGVVTATVVDGALQLITPRAGIRRAQAIVKKNQKGTGSIVDKLIAERREAARRGD